MSETAPEFSASAQAGNPIEICAATIREEEQNLAALQVRRSQVALAATLGTERARKEAAVLERSEARIRRRLELARLALAELGEPRRVPR